MFGEAQIEKLLYTFTLPFLRRVTILCCSVLPNAFTTLSLGGAADDECQRLLTLLHIPLLSDPPNQDMLRNKNPVGVHTGHSHAASQLNIGAIWTRSTFPSYGLKGVQTQSFPQSTLQEILNEQCLNKLACSSYLNLLS